MFIQKKGGQGSTMMLSIENQSPHFWSGHLLLDNVFQCVLKKTQPARAYFGCRSVRGGEAHVLALWIHGLRGPQQFLLQHGPPHLRHDLQSHDLSPGSTGLLQPTPAPLLAGNCAYARQVTRAWPTLSGASLSTAIWPLGTAWWVRTWWWKCADFGLSRNIYSLTTTKPMKTTPSPSVGCPGIPSSTTASTTVWRVGLQG